jgi:hypothetical protein
MSRPRGYTPGDWLAVCFRCGSVKLASTMRRQWQGYWVCPQHWETRHPQDFVKNVQDVQTVPWSQPRPADIEVLFCTFNGQSAIPQYSMPGCMIPGRFVVDYAIEPVEIVPLCDIYDLQGMPGWAQPGCSVPGSDPIAASAGGYY